MINKTKLRVLFFLLFPLLLNAQTYNSDSLKIVIRSRTNFVVRGYDDLNLRIDLLSRSAKKILCYQKLRSVYRSTFGNCYFELFKFDSTSTPRDITQSVIAIVHPPRDFKNKEETNTYDIEKSSLSPHEKRTLIFNVLDFIPDLDSGNYSMVFYLRNFTNYGFDKDGHVVAASINYLESIDMNFDVVVPIVKMKRIEP